MSDALKIVLAVYLVIMNVAGLIIMGADKNRAKNKKWRIPEKVFFIVSVLGGSVGTWAGMYFFRHKTRHWYFVIGIPFIIAAQAALLIYLGSKGVL